MEIFISREFESVQVSIRWEERNVPPENIDDGTRVGSGRGGEGKRRESKEKGYVRNMVFLNFYFDHSTSIL